MSNIPPPIPRRPPTEQYALDPTAPSSEPVLAAQVVEYESPMHAARPPSSALYWLAIAGWGIAAGVAIVIFLGAIVTDTFFFAIAGVAWLYIGGFLTLIALVLGIIYGALALSASFPPPATRVRAVLAWLLPLSNIALAVVLAMGGIMILQYAASKNPNGLWTPTPVTPAPATTPITTRPFITLTATNATTQRIESAGVILPTGKRIDLGPIESGATVDKRFIPLAGSGAVVVNCTQRGNVRWSQTVEAWITNGQTPNPEVTVSLSPSQANR